MMALLVIAYTLNFIDRQIAGILAEPIKHDLHLTDKQLGWLGGTAFALFYTVLAIPIARLADRKDRSVILTVGLALWSLATAICGFAQNFVQLFLARMSVGIGEAAGVAPAYSLLTDLFPAEKRARGMALFSLGVPLGSALGVVFGGLIAAKVDWRMAFMVLGVVGLLFAPIYKKGVHDPGHSNRETASLGEVFSVIARKPTFWLMSFAAGIGSLVSYGLAFWIPSFLARSFHLELVDRSLIFGATVFVGGVAGVWLGRRDRRSPAHGTPVSLCARPDRHLCTLPADLPAGLLKPVDCAHLIPLCDPNCPEPRLARARHRRDHRARATPHARNCVGDVPVHQQPDRPWPRHFGHRYDFGRADRALC